MFRSSECFRTPVLLATIGLCALSAVPVVGTRHGRNSGGVLRVVPSGSTNRVAAVAAPSASAYRAPVKWAPLVESDAWDRSRLGEAFDLPLRTDSPAQFGSAIAVGAETVAVAAPWSPGTHGAFGSGAVQLFERQGSAWAPSAWLAPTDECPRGQFGAALAMDDQTLLVGSPGWGPANASLGEGAVDVYRRGEGEWHHAQRVLAPRASFEFGAALAIDGAHVLIGAPGDYRDVDQGGAVFAYRLVDGVLELDGELRPTAPAWKTRFGAAVALAGETAFVGAPRPGAEAPGAVFVYRAEGRGWRGCGELSGSSAEGQFGATVAASGDLVVVGAPMARGSKTGAGRAFLYKEAASGRPRLVASLQPSGSGPSGGSSPGEGLAPEGCAEFGASLATDGQRVLVGSGTSGAVLLYGRDGDAWRLRQRLPQPAETTVGQVVALGSGEAWLGYPLGGAAPAFADRVGDGRVRVYTVSTRPGAQVRSDLAVAAGEVAGARRPRPAGGELPMTGSTLQATARLMRSWVEGRDAPSSARGEWTGQREVCLD